MTTGLAGFYLVQLFEIHLYVNCGKMMLSNAIDLELFLITDDFSMFDDHNSASKYILVTFTSQFYDCRNVDYNKESVYFGLGHRERERERDTNNELFKFGFHYAAATAATYY